MNRIAMIGCICLCGALSACFQITAYVDPGLRKIRYTDLVQPKEPFSLGALVEFQRDGQEFPSVNESARNAVLRALKASKLFSSVSSGVAAAEGTLEVVINNSGGSTDGSPTATGLTLGAVGTGTVDRYIITATYQGPERQPIVIEYQHAILSTIGMKAGPKGLEPMTVGAAFSKIIEEVMLLLLYELQEKGVL